METNSIPKIIHYCWFGGGEKPDYVFEYIKKWETVLPDYEIIEWNETNFDVNFCKYTKEAYSMKKYAFVSDVARLYALQKCGGFYLDTDVEIIKSFSDLIDNEKSCILGFEVENRIATSFIAACKNNELIKQFLDSYLEKKFIENDGTLNMIPNVEYLTDILKSRGLIENGEFQQLNNGIFIYPLEYFSPYDYINCINNINEKTYCVHHFAVSWLNKSTIVKRKIKTILAKILGKKGIIFLRKIKNLFFNFK